MSVLIDLEVSFPLRKKPQGLRYDASKRKDTDEGNSEPDDP